MDRPTVAVVLAGGTGTRLYPASRADRPKQFLRLGGDRSLLVRAVERGSVADRRVVLTAPRHADRTRTHLETAGFAVREWGSGEAGSDPDGRDPDGEAIEILVEPEPKDTGPALVYAAARIRADASDAGNATDAGDTNAEYEPALLCLPSDHHVEGPFGDLAGHALRVADETRGLVTVGIEPTRPATGYGYVQPWREEDGYAPVRAFHEKPDRDRARELIDDGSLWNAGIFAWTPSALLRAARDTPLAPIAGAAGDHDGDRNSETGAESEGETGTESDLDRALRSAYAAVDPVSIDYAVLERAGDVFVVEATGIEWDDLGTWDALGRVVERDGDGNAVLGGGAGNGDGNRNGDGDGNALAVDARENVIATDDAHVTAVGVEDLVIAAYDDRVLVVPTAEAGRVRKAVDRLREEDLF